MSLRISVVMLICSLLAGCASNEAAPLPTQMDLNLIASEAAATAVAIASPTREGLPPTWTPSPEPTQAATEAGLLPSAQPANFNSAGTIYYLYNGDAIVRLIGDGSFEELLPIPHISLGVSQLTLSPEGSLVAYVGPGSGSAREIYVTDRMGSNTRQVSQLGFAEIGELAWRPDSGSLAFVAAQSAEFPSEIYVIGADGTGQRPLTQRQSRDVRDLAWNQDGSKLFFSDSTIFAIDLASGAVSPSLSAFTGFGPDFALTHSPNTAELYYLKPWRDLESGKTEFILTQMDTASLDPIPEEREGARLDASQLRFNRDGSFLLISSDTSVSVQSQAFNTAVQVVRNNNAPPIPVLSPDSETVAFVAVDEAGVQQIYATPRQGGAVKQLTFHQEGSISDLFWVEG